MAFKVLGAHVLQCLTCSPGHPTPRVLGHRLHPPPPPPPAQGVFSQQLVVKRTGLRSWSTSTRTTCVYMLNAFSARLCKMRCYMNVICCSLKIPPSKPGPGTKAAVGVGRNLALGCNIVRPSARFSDNLLGL